MALEVAGEPDHFARGDRDVPRRLDRPGSRGLDIHASAPGRDEFEK
jgi:hypothetical protein